MFSYCSLLIGYHGSRLIDALKSCAIVKRERHKGLHLRSASHVTQPHSRQTVNSVTPNFASSVGATHPDQIVNLLEQGLSIILADHLPKYRTESG